MLKTRTWIIILSIILAVSILLSAVIFLRKPSSLSVQILQNGNCIKEINLNDVESPYKFTVEDENGGSNTILVEHGRISIIEADCPDQVCVRRGWLSNDAAPIVCLPHKLVIQTVAETDVDSVTQ